MKEKFGTYKDGTELSLYTLENENIRMAVTDYGASLVRFVEKSTGRDIVLGFDDGEGYMSQIDTCIGASIGRTANRTAKGRFTLNGIEYRLPINNNGNSHHGGLEGFDRKKFEAQEYADRVVFHRISPDGEEGYPGDLDVTVTYQLLDDGVAIITEGKALNRDTLFAYTNHSYFNLDEEGSVLDHSVQMNSEYYAHSDKDGLMTGTLEPVKDTPFDFRTFTKLGEHINDDDEQLRLGNGYDHFYKVDGEGLRDMLRCRGRDLELVLRSDYPGFHVYTSNYMEGIHGKKGRIYGRRDSVAFEAEYYPNAINYPAMEQPVVRCGETQTHRIEYRIRPYSE